MSMKPATQKTKHPQQPQCDDVTVIKQADSDSEMSGDECDTESEELDDDNDEQVQPVEPVC
jgi:hypothetical protein